MTVDVCDKQVIGHLETQNACLKAQSQTIQNRGCTGEFSCVKAKKKSFGSTYARKKKLFHFGGKTHAP